MKQLQKLSAKHYCMMVLRMEGYDYREIAIQTQSAYQTVKSLFSGDDLFRDTFNQLTQDYIEQARAMIRGAAPDAAKRVIKLQNHESGTVALAAARDILDRAGLKPSDQIDATIRHSGAIEHDVCVNLAQLSDDDLAALERILERASESVPDQTGASTSEPE